jgi:hypothetical protein
LKVCYWKIEIPIPAPPHLAGAPVAVGVAAPVVAIITPLTGAAIPPLINSPFPLLVNVL